MWGVALDARVSDKRFIHSFTLVHFGMHDVHFGMPDVLFLTLF
jgi:hypothetical protein